jgi:hypothetical protein
MATAKPYPFKETPILFGDDAVRFELEIENPVSVSAAERQAQADDYEYLRSIATFPMP